MNLLRPLFLSSIIAAVGWSADLQIAIIDRSEIDDMIKIKVLARPENADAKKAAADLDLQSKELQAEMMKTTENPQDRKPIIEKMSALHMKRNETEKAVKSQIETEMIRIIKEATKGKYPVVMDADEYREAVITKNVEIIDITVDIKEYLLTK